MTSSIRRYLAAATLLSTGILGGCVWRSDYDAVVQQNKDLQSQVEAQQAQLAQKDEQISRLQGAIKYTVNSDLLFPSGGYEMSSAGKTIIGRLAKKLAPTQQNHLFVNGYTDNVAIGPALAAQGITSNEILSQKRAENVMQFLISQGVSPDLVSAKGFGEADPIASNDTAEGRAKNRRVELTLHAPT